MIFDCSANEISNPFTCLSAKAFGTVFVNAYKFSFKVGFNIEAEQQTKCTYTKQARTTLICEFSAPVSLYGFPLEVKHTVYRFQLAEPNTWLYQHLAQLLHGMSQI